MSRLNHFLEGIKVVDLSRHLPGPLASLHLADMGAEVIKVEPPYGDELRFIGPEAQSGNSAWFDAVNAGKQGIKLDLKQDHDRDRLMQLLDDADVMIESFRPGVLDKLGLGITTLKEKFPRLVICSLNGYGENSPLGKEVGHDLNYLAMNGLLEGTGTAEQTVAPWPPVADCAGGLYGLSTILAALLEREKSGSGSHVEVALADSPMPLISFSLADLSISGKGMSRAEALLNGGAARYRTYTTSDGKSIALGAVEPKFWENFCRAAGREDWIERIKDPLPQNDLQAEVAELVQSMTLEQCNKKFAAAECCYNEVLDLARAVKTPHLEERKLVIKSDSGDYQALYPAWVDGQPPEERPAFVEPDQAKGS